MNPDAQIQEVKNATLQRFNRLWKNNFEINLPSVQNNPGVASLKNRFENVPWIVIGAGPSLDKNIRLLERARGKAVLIASDAALKPLLAHAIVPDFTASLDPQIEITKFFKNCPHRGITLIVPSIIHPQVLDLWQGGVVFYHKFAPDIPLLTQIQNRVPHLGCLTPGGSVLSVAYDLAFQSGGDPILFVGQDLSYPQPKTHSRQSENSAARLETTFTQQPENIVRETDLNGRSLPTLKSMAVSKKWFHWAFRTWKRSAPLNIINCSEAGILTEHCQLMALNEALFRFCKRKVNVAWTLKKALNRKR